MHQNTRYILPTDWDRENIKILYYKSDDALL